MLINDSPQERVSERWRQVNRICQHLASYFGVFKEKRSVQEGVAVASMNTREHTLLNVSFKIRVHYIDAFHLHGRHKWRYVFASIDRRPVMMYITASKVHACVYHMSHLGADLADWLHHPGELNGCFHVSTEVSLTWGGFARLLCLEVGLLLQFPPKQKTRRSSTSAQVYI